MCALVSCIIHLNDVFPGLPVGAELVWQVEGPGLVPSTTSKCSTEKCLHLLIELFAF